MNISNNKNYLEQCFLDMSNFQFNINYGTQPRLSSSLSTSCICAVFLCQVTIFGESAGAQSVSLHLMIQSSKPLFKQAVLQSLPFSIPLKTRWGWFCFLVYDSSGEWGSTGRMQTLNVPCMLTERRWTTVLLCLSIFLSDTMPWSLEKALQNRPTALWATSSACCLSLHRPSWLPKWKQVGRYKHQPTLTKLRAALRTAHTVT